MTIRVRKFLQYVIYGSLLSVVTLLLSIISSTKRADQSYAHMSNPLVVPNASADIPFALDGGDAAGSGGADCEAGSDGGADCT